MEKRHDSKSEPHRRRVVLRCAACGKSLASVTSTGRKKLEWSNVTGVRLDVALGHEAGEGGDSAWCSNVRCGAGPRYFPEGLDRQIRDALERGEASLRLDLRAEG